MAKKVQLSVWKMMKIYYFSYSLGIWYQRSLWRLWFRTRQLWSTRVPENSHFWQVYWCYQCPQCHMWGRIQSWYFAWLGMEIRWIWIYQIHAIMLWSYLLWRWSTTCFKCLLQSPWKRNLEVQRWWNNYLYLWKSRYDSFISISF